MRSGATHELGSGILAVHHGHGFLQTHLTVYLHIDHVPYLPKLQAGNIPYIH